MPQQYQAVCLVSLYVLGSIKAEIWDSHTIGSLTLAQVLLFYPIYSAGGRRGASPADCIVPTYRLYLVCQGRLTIYLKTFMLITLCLLTHQHISPPTLTISSIFQCTYITPDPKSSPKYLPTHLPTYSFTERKWGGQPWPWLSPDLPSPFNPIHSTKKTVRGIRYDNKSGFNTATQYTCSKRSRLHRMNVDHACCAAHSLPT